MTRQEIDNKIKNAPNLTGTTGNERLFLSGLLGEFERCLKGDKIKARYILEKLGFDSKSIGEILKATSAANNGYDQ